MAMMKFLHTLLRPDQEEQDQDQADVAEAANILQIGEFQLLQLAYADWHGENLPDSKLNPLFTNYMVRKQTPPWARHYARRIIDWDARGLLVPNAAEYHRFDRGYAMSAPTGIKPFCTAALVLVFALSGALWISHQSVDGQTSSSYLPPYFNDKNMHSGATFGDAKHQDIGSGS
ncbi:MAG: hypothetical protein HOJ06_05230 [Rhodospirillaceae bacterium]|jgi:hypothetical protein|nr:hypothetical protein [Rhodospirillaceae bacterium]MBT5810565.1 hypothetical protein [Rhodospirillaceae bacterium]